jgi:hypothetical protein
MNTLLYYPAYNTWTHYCIFRTINYDFFTLKKKFIFKFLAYRKYVKLTKDMGSTSGQNQNVEKCDMTQCYIKWALSSLSRKIKDKQLSWSQFM